MIKKYFTAIVFASICYVSTAQIQNPTLSNLSLDKRTGLPRYAEFSAPSGFTEVAFLDWFMKKYQFKPGVTFEILRTDVDDIGFTHSRYKQYYKGIEVLHSMLILHSKNGYVESFNGDYFNNFSDNAFSIDSDMARTIALSSYGSGVIGKWEIAAEEKFIQQLKNDSHATWFPKIATEYYAYPEYYDGKLPLVPCYSFDIALSDPHVYQQVLVDAVGKKVYRTIPLEVHTDSAGKAVTVYEGTKNIVADFVTTNSFRLRESGARKVETYKGSTGVDYTDGDNFWNNGTDKIAGDIHYGAELVSDFLKVNFNTNSYDNKGGALVAVSSGGSGNAFWNLGSNFATFLVGSSGSVGPCASIDVVGHEFGHGVADEIAGLVYSGEACALHESFADISGHNAEWQNDSTKANWYIGEKVWSSTNGIRYMRDPFVFNNPKAYGGQFFPQGCHGSGGVQNYWFYIQVAGDTAKNEFSYSYSLPGMGHKKANAILYRSMFYYMVPNGLFSDQYMGTLKAAKDLYGSCSYELEHTYKAWKAVNVEDTSVKTVDLSHGIKAPTLICNGAPVTSTLNSFGDVSRKTFWQIGNTDTTSKRSFAYSFNKTGKYHIKLTTTTCGKSFVDSMYIMINYSPKPLFKVPFDTSCASKAQVTITNNTINADKIIPLKYSWYVNPGALSDTNKHLKTSFPDAMDYEIQLKAYYEGGCWSVTKKLVTLLEAPKPKFTVVRDVCENRAILVRNNTDTTNKKLDFEWIFPDNTVFKGFEPKTKSLNTYGNYKIILKGIFPFGGCSDTVQRNIKILPNPKPDFTFKNNCQGLQMSVYGAGSSTAPKQWNQWHLGTYNPINKDSLAFAALDSASRTVGYTLGDSAGCFATTYKTIILEKLSAQMQVDKVCFGES
ncbi:MAG: M4 family metallopeptidase, partial [Bacteroidia bacterium]|nr:M4 family metallopeptidase [Bacteroidia bacterium]